MTTYRDLLLTRPAYPPLVCADGAQVSLQAGYGLYSTPRDNHGPYTHVEAGFPSVPPPASWRPYAEFGIAYADDPDLIAGAIYAQLCAHSSRGRVWMSSSPSTEGPCRQENPCRSADCRSADTTPPGVCRGLTFPPRCGIIHGYTGRVHRCRVR